ncbi:MAG: type I pullulanase [Saprospiraceae bacterium]
MKYLVIATSFLLFFMTQLIAQPKYASFDDYPVYEGNDLGLTYSPQRSTFKIWSPLGTSAKINLYKQGTGGEPALTQNMDKDEATGVFSVTLEGDLEGMFYTFQVNASGYGWLEESPDPYAIATGVNGKRAMIVDLAKTNPAGWENDKRPQLNSYADIILYELHLRDISVDSASGIQHKGKFLGLAETNTQTPDSLATGLGHIVEMGVTHVHILPSFDFKSIDESRLDQNKYNWGYDPQNYNVPEGSYSTDPFDGRVRIKEFKQMVKTLHDNGLRVIMDVVYNHTFDTDHSVFNQIAPKYYYRQGPHGIYSNASGCGNETASERPMMRKYIVESMLYWAKEYHVDGFRVDLMGIHDLKTMNLVADELRKLDPTLFVYGEGWTAGDSPLDVKERAVKANAHLLNNVAVFSDEFRDGVKGHVFTPTARGFINGQPDLEESVKLGIVGAIAHPQVDNKLVNYSQDAWAKSPTQCINYVSCHDNHTLWDRLKLSNPMATEEELVLMDKTAQTLVMTSQGIPFLHAGEEFARTKYGVENSFESPDSINMIRWERKAAHADLVEYYKKLIQLRKEHPAFRMGNADSIRAHLEFLKTPFENVIAYMLKDHANGDSWGRILVLFNGNKVGKAVDIPSGKWNIVCQDGIIKLDGMGTVTGPRAMVAPYAALILVEE